VVVYEAALLASVESWPCPFVYEPSVQSGFKDVLPAEEEEYEELWWVRRCSLGVRWINASLTMAKTRPECLIIGDRTTFGMLAKPGRTPPWCLLSLTGVSMVYKADPRDASNKTPLRGTGRLPQKKVNQL
jgi:hypothetical protein